LPVRAIVALVATVMAVVLMASFRTPDVVATHTSRIPAAIGTPPPSGDTTATPAPSAPASDSPQPSASTSGSRNGSYDGSTVSTRYGDVQVRVIISGGRISDVQPVTLPSDRQRSALISQEAAPLLHDEVVQAQSAQIDVISGATYTSYGYAQSLQAALDKAH
jgi:uncharacterized protein with FMN-binding domain